MIGIGDRDVELLAEYSKDLQEEYEEDDETWEGSPSELQLRYLPWDQSWRRTLLGFAEGGDHGAVAHRRNPIATRRPRWA